MRCWLGVDCGSVSVKFALIDEAGQPFRTLYLKNQGISETVQQGLRELLDDEVEVAGIGCTGSGRNYLRILLGADVVKTEVLAHTVATLHLHPGVRTIMDIGGEDCKIMEVVDGVLTNFIMNNICGAGTGAMIESIATRLGIAIHEVGALALKSRQRLELPGKCGIFCQSAVVTKLNAGAHRSDIMMGVVRALISNYLTLARGIRLEPPFVLQGATALNPAVVCALEEQLDHAVIVPRQCAVMGAIGMGLMTREAMPDAEVRPPLNVDIRDYHSVGFTCHDCPNDCEVTQLFQDDRLLGSVGSRCAKWDRLVYCEEQEQVV